MSYAPWLKELHERMDKIERRQEELATVASNIMLAMRLLNPELDRAMKKIEK